jgi:hypothetical protein
MNADVIDDPVVIPSEPPPAGITAMPVITASMIALDVPEDREDCLGCRKWAEAAGRPIAESLPCFGHFVRADRLRERIAEDPDLVDLAERRAARPGLGRPKWGQR